MANFLNILTNELFYLLFTVTLLIITLSAQLATPRLFFWLIWTLARKTPLGYLLCWRQCLATYYTNNKDESGHIPVDSEVARKNYSSVGLICPDSVKDIRAVDEEILFVSFAGRFVGWSNLAPNRIRVFGMLHDKTILHGVWSDWHSDTRFRGTLLLELDHDRSKGGRGVWVGAAKGRSENNPSGIRTFPWIWHSFGKIPKYSKFKSPTPQTGKKAQN